MKTLFTIILGLSLFSKSFAWSRVVTVPGTSSSDIIILGFVGLIIGIIMVKFGSKYEIISRIGWFLIVSGGLTAIINLGDQLLLL